MFSETLILTILLTLVFISGTLFGQLVLKLKLAKLEKENLLLEQKKVMDLKSILKGRSSKHRRSRHKSTDDLVRDEIDDIIDDIEGKI